MDAVDDDDNEDALTEDGNGSAMFSDIEEEDGDGDAGAANAPLGAYDTDSGAGVGVDTSRGPPAYESLLKRSLSPAISGK